MSANALISNIAIRFLASDPCYNYFHPLAHDWLNIHSCRVVDGNRLSSFILRFSTDIGSKIEAKKKRTLSLCGTTATPTVTNIDITLPTRDISRYIFSSLFTLRSFVS